MAVRQSLSGLLLGTAAFGLVAGCTAADQPAAETPLEAAASASSGADFSAHYLGNEGVMIVQGNTKVLFDPLYRNGFNTYHLVPADLKAKLLAGAPPFDHVDAMLISHAHGDHFDAPDILAFHETNPDALIIGPPQAIAQILETGAVSARLENRLVPMGLEYGADPLSLSFEDLQVEAVRIPHAGGPGRREIENLVYRVTLQAGATVMHMGDADPALHFFTPYDAHWQARRTDVAMPPYWFFLSAEGVSIVDEHLNAAEAIGVHVPVSVPVNLKSSGRAYFSTPDEVRPLQTD